MYHWHIQQQKTIWEYCQCLWWLYKVWNWLITSMAIQYTLEGKSFNYFFGWSHCCYDTQIIFPMNKKVHDPSMPPTESHFSPQKSDKLCLGVLKTSTINPNILTIFSYALKFMIKEAYFIVSSLATSLTVSISIPNKSCQSIQSLSLCWTNLIQMPCYIKSQDKVNS